MKPRAFWPRWRRPVPTAADVEHQNTQDRLISLAVLVQGLDLRSYIERLDRAEAVGPVLDPTLFREAGGNLSRLKRLAEAARPFVDEAGEFFRYLTDDDPPQDAG